MTDRLEPARSVIEQLAAMTAERAEVIERLGGLFDDESLLDAIGLIVDEWKHYSQAMNEAGYVTIPRLTAERDAALADAARLRAALEWYASASNYDLEELYSEDPRLRAAGVTYRSRRILEDAGERARQALGDGQGDAG